MKRSYEGIGTTTHKDKNGNKLSLEDLENILKSAQTKLRNGNFFPLLFEHDLSLEMYGVCNNFRIKQLEDGEYALIFNLYKFSELTDEEKIHFKTKVIELIKIISNSQDIVKFDHRGIHYLYKNGIVLEKYPNLKSEIDNRDNLLKLDDHYKIEKGGILNHNIIIPHHNFFRRSEIFQNNYNGDLISNLIELSKNKDISIQIKINEDYLYSDIKLEYLKHDFYLELDHWFGPKFNANFSKIKDGNGFLKYPDIINYYGIDGIAYRLISKDDENLIEFIIEEFRFKDNTPFIINNGSKFYKTKFIHAILDVKGNNISHYDPALKFYNQKLFDELNEKRKQNPSYMPKVPNIYDENQKGKIKIYRLDGKINLNDFMQNIYMFYRGNVIFLELLENRKIWEEPEGKALSDKQEHLSAGLSISF